MSKKLRLEELKEAKLKLMRMYVINPNKYANTINWVDKRIGQVTGVLLVLLILFVGGCKAGFGLGADVSAYYPNIPNKLEDPAESRRQATVHTTSMKRNNRLPMVKGGN